MRQRMRRSVFGAAAAAAAPAGLPTHFLRSRAPCLNACSASCPAQKSHKLNPSTPYTPKSAKKQGPCSRPMCSAHQPWFQEWSESLPFMLCTSDSDGDPGLDLGAFGRGPLLGVAGNPTLGSGRGSKMSNAAASATPAAGSTALVTPYIPPQTLPNLPTTRFKSADCQANSSKVKHRFSTLPPV